jgi:transcription initiation factor TFIIIB Brf1 subunit/transcription initiation factor TFIIB
MNNAFNNTNLRDMFENIDFDDLDSDTNIDTKVNKKRSQDKTKKSICHNCDSVDNIIEDFSLGIVVCKKCGQVVDNIIDSNPEWRSFEDDAKGNTANRCGSGVSSLLPQSSLGTTIGGGKFKSRIKTLHNWSAMPYRERSLHQVFKKFQEKCAYTGILKCIEDDAKIMYKTISECKHIDGKNKGKFIIIRGKNRISLIAACIFFACKRKGMTRSPKEMATIFNINYTDITRGCKNFQKYIKKGNININTGFSLPEDFVARFCKELNIKDKYIEHAVQIAKNISNMNIASVHTPFSIATSSILLMVDLNNLENITKKKIAHKFGVSEVTISKTFKKVEEYKHILNSQERVNEFIKNKLIEKMNQKIPTELLPRFEKFNIPTTKEKLIEYKFSYSNIFTEENLFNNIKNTNIEKLRKQIKKVSNKIKNNKIKSLSETKILYSN